MPTTFSIAGGLEMETKLSRLVRKFPDEVKGALYIETEIDTTEVKKRTPVLHGNLRSSVHQDGPYIEGTRIFTFIVAGGVSASYAIYVHENLTANHPRGGQAKFLESVIVESRSTMAARIAKRISLARAMNG